MLLTFLNESLILFSHSFKYCSKTEASPSKTVFSNEEYDMYLTLLFVYQPLYQHFPFTQKCFTLLQRCSPWILQPEPTGLRGAFNKVPYFLFTGIWNCRRLLKIHDVIAIHIMRYLTNYYDFKFKEVNTPELIGQKVRVRVTMLRF